MLQQKRTPEEEQARQLKLISYQLSPMTVFLKIGFWLAAVLLGLGFLSMLATGFKGFR